MPCCDEAFEWNWCPTVKGNVKRAIRIQESTGETTLVSVALVFRDSTAATVLTLSSADADEITLTATAPGAWDITIQPIPTASLPVGTLTFGITFTDDSGAIDTDVTGRWTITL